MDFFDFDLERKIKKENIIWKDNYYDIWNPIISDEEDMMFQNFYLISKELLDKFFN